MAKGDLTGIIWPREPLGVKSHDWKRMRAFVEILTGICSISKWDTESNDDDPTAVPVVFDIEGIEMSYRLGDTKYAMMGIALPIASDPSEIYRAIAGVKLLMDVGYSTRSSYT